MELVIMAAGMGSRFGGLKQIEPMGPNGEFLIDYSIYDAIKYGFDKVVFIIKKENYDVFKDTIGKRVEDKIKVEYVFQDFNTIPEGYKIPEDRVKPLGTAHAIYCCRDVVKSSFAIINADDFYGEDAFRLASEFLSDNSDYNLFGMVGYQVGNTLTENGSVKRGVCQFEDGYLTSLIESSVSKEDGKIVAKPLDGSKEFECNNDTLVSMNMFLFTPHIFDLLDKDIYEFLNDENKVKNNGEFLIPDVVFDNIRKDDIKVRVLNTDAKWYGVTYKEDTPNVRESISKLVDDGVYPKNLW